MANENITGKLFNQGNMGRMHNYPGVKDSFYLVVEDSALRKCTPEEYDATPVTEYERVSIGGTSHYYIHPYEDGQRGEQVGGEEARHEFDRVSALPIER